MISSRKEKVSEFKVGLYEGQPHSSGQFHTQEFMDSKNECIGIIKILKKEVKLRGYGGRETWPELGEYLGESDQNTLYKILKN